MKKLSLIFVLLVGIMTTFSSCRNSSDNIKITGVIVEQGITIYQYGTHVMATTAEIFALRSSTINLDDYVDRNVTIQGYEVEGYPVDGGPVLIEVEEVQ